MYASSTTTAQGMLEATDITRAFRTSGNLTHVLSGISLRVRPGEFVALRGRSGSGKTTLLNILVGLDSPSQGSVSLLGQRLGEMNDSARAALRRQYLGLLFQNAHLLPTLTALENVELSLRLLHVPAKERKQRATEILERVSLAGRVNHRALELSGGEQQRVALARALVHRPRFLIADEPTGNLDSLTAQKMLGLLQEMVQETQVGLLIATHDANLVHVAHTVLSIEDGRLA